MGHEHPKLHNMSFLHPTKPQKVHLTEEGLGYQNEKKSFNWCNCMPCVLCDILALRSLMFILSVTETKLAKMAFVACFAPCFSE